MERRRPFDEMAWLRLLADTLQLDWVIILYISNPRTCTQEHVRTAAQNV